MNDNYWTAQAMIKYGGTFVVQLGVMIPLADSDNLAKLQEIFPEYFAKYVVLGQHLKNQEKSHGIR